MNNDEKAYLDADGVTQLVRLIYDSPDRAFFVDEDGDISIDYGHVETRISDIEEG